jgi:hypothetical protein
MRRAIRALPAALAAVAVIAVSGVSVTAQEDGNRLYLDLLARAGDGSFSGVVRVEWRDTTGEMQSTRVRVQRRGGVTAIDGDRGVLAANSDRYLEGAGGWTSIGAAVSGDLPDLTEKWELRPTGTAFVASMRTAEVEVIERDSGLVRQRVYLTDVPPYVMKREILDANGDPYRVVEFVAHRGPTAGPQSAPAEYDVDEPVAVDPPADVPEAVGDGYQLVSAYELDDVVHLFYSDGLFGVSVFVDEGDLDADALPSGATKRDVEGEDVQAYATASGDVLVWEDEDDRVLAWVSDAPPDALAGVAASFTGDDEPSLWGRAADVVLGPFAWS